MVATILGLGFLCVFVGLGHRVCKFFSGLSWGSLALEMAVCAGIGMGLTSYAVLLIGSLGGMAPLPMALLSVALFLTGVGPARAMTRRASQHIKRMTRERSAWPWMILAVAALLLGGIGALGPEIGGDALCYHLHCPREFLRMGRIAYIPYDPNSHYPFLMQNLFGLGLALDGPALAKLFHAMTGFLTALALYGWTKRDLGVRAGMIAALVFLLTPGTFNLLGVAYVDLGLVFFTFLSLAAFLKFIQERRIAFAVLSGVLMGFALSTKLLAAYSVCVFAFLFIIDALTNKSAAKGRAMGVVAFSLAAFAFSAWWYLKSYAVFGNPVHPFFSELFGYSLKPPSAHNYERSGLGRGLMALLALPWRMTFRYEVFEEFATRIGPVFLAFAPGLLLARRWPATWKLMGCYVFSFTLLWFFMQPMMRFWFPAAAPLAALIALAATRVGTRGEGMAGRLLRGVLALMLAWQLFMGIYHYRDAIATVWRPAKQRAHWENTQRSYGIAQWINANLPTDAVILNAHEVHGYFIERRLVREHLYWRWTRYDDGLETPQEVFARLKKEGFTHVLYTEDAFTQDRQAKQGPLRVERIVADPGLAARFLLPLHSERFQGKDGQEIVYHLHEIL